MVSPFPREQIYLNWKIAAQHSSRKMWEKIALLLVGEKKNKIRDLRNMILGTTLKQGSFLPGITRVGRRMKEEVKTQLVLKCRNSYYKE